MFFSFQLITNSKIVKFIKISFTDKPAQFFFGLVGLFCTGILFTSLFIEHVLKIQPCILCTIQRFCFLIILILCIIYFIISTTINNKHKQPTLDSCFLVVVALFSILGSIVAFRQSWLQIYSGFSIPSCSSSLLEMLKDHSILDIIYMAIRGKLECSSIGLTIFGLSLANWGLINFIIILVLDLITIIKIVLNLKN